MFLVFGALQYTNPSEACSRKGIRCKNKQKTPNLCNIKYADSSTVLTHLNKGADERSFQTESEKRESLCPIREHKCVHESGLAE